MAINCRALQPPPGANGLVAGAGDLARVMRANGLLTGEPDLSRLVEPGPLRALGCEGTPSRR